MRLHTYVHLVKVHFFGVAWPRRRVRCIGETVDQTQVFLDKDNVRIATAERTVYEEMQNRGREWEPLNEHGAIDLHLYTCGDAARSLCQEVRRNFYPPNARRQASRRETPAVQDSPGESTQHGGMRIHARACSWMDRRQIHRQTREESDSQTGDEMNREIWHREIWETNPRNTERQGNGKTERGSPRTDGWNVRV